ncbi:MAG TPA: rhamnogalacturonan acetylesterase [Micromonosporaceae bacterium]
MRVFIAGDSTAVTRPVSYLPMAGWGQMLPLFLADDVDVINCARGRASSKSFYERGRFQWITANLAPGDYVLISFGQVDCMVDDGLHTEPFDDFQAFLRRYVEGARTAGAHPVLVIPHERRRFDKHGNLERYLGDYPVATSEVALAEAVPLIDLYGQSVDWWQELGSERAKEVFVYLRPGEPIMPKVQDLDDIHLRAPGAIECARFVARSLRDQGVLPASLVTGLDRYSFDASELGWLDEETFHRRTSERSGPAVAA